MRMVSKCCCSAAANTRTHMQQVKLLEASFICAASLEYEYSCQSDDFGNDAILSTCDSFMCGGQVEPTAESDKLMLRLDKTSDVLSTVEHLKSNLLPVQLSHQDIDGVTERLAMSKAFFYSQHLDAKQIKHGISNLVAGYPVLAGRLGKTAGTGQPCIRLSNAGVQFRHLQSSASMEYFQANNMRASSRHGSALPNWTEAMDCKALAHGQEPLMKVVLLQPADQGSILSVTLAHCVADGSGFTRILQSLARMCSNQPGLPMRFGAHHLYPPTPLTPNASSAAQQHQQQQEVDVSTLDGNLVHQSGKMVKADLDSQAQHALTQGHLHQAKLVFQPETGIRKRLKLAWQLLPGLVSSMVGKKCKQVLHIPAPLVHALKAELQGKVPQQKLSCNDVLSALLWHVACDIRGRPRPWQGSRKGQGCLAYPLNLRALHVPPHYCGNALLLNLLPGMLATPVVSQSLKPESGTTDNQDTTQSAKGGPTARSEGNPRRHSATTLPPQTAAPTSEKHTTSTDREISLQEVAFCASRISSHTAEAKQAPTVGAALSLLQAAADAPPLAKRLSLCVLGVGVDLWVSNWSNLYQLEGMRIGDATPHLFLGHSIGPQLGTAAVILQPDKSCYHVDWYIPGRLANKLVQHHYWGSLLPGCTWLGACCLPRPDQKLPQSA